MANESSRDYASPTLGELAAAFSTVARGSIVMLAVALVALTAAYVVFDAVVPADDQFRLQSILSILGVVVAYALTRHLLVASAPPGLEAPAQRVGAYIGLGIITGLGTIFGLVLLVVPGLILAARWMLAAPILLAENATVGDAMSRSWTATAGRWGKLIVAQILVSLPLAAGVGVAMIGGLDAETPSLAISIAQNAAISLFSIASVVLAVAAYRVIVPSSHTLADVFA